MSASRIHAPSPLRAPLPSRALAHVLNAVDEEQVRRAVEGPLYHVTYLSRMPSIVEEGLGPGGSRSIGSSAYDAHVRGQVFLTEPDGVSFWMSRAEDHAHANSDDLLEDLLVPVVLRVDPDCFWNDELKADVLGTRDASADAWMTSDLFPAECLEVYAGKKGWVPADDYEKIDPLVALDVEMEEPDRDEDDPDFDEDRDDEPKYLYDFKYHSPLEPEL